MSVLVGKQTKLLVQGITGSAGGISDLSMSSFRCVFAIPRIYALNPERLSKIVPEPGAPATRVSG